MQHLLISKETINTHFMNDIKTNRSKIDAIQKEKKKEKPLTFHKGTFAKETKKISTILLTISTLTILNIILNIYIFAS